MRIKSARPRVSAHATTADLDPTELLHSEQLPVPTRTKRPESEERRAASPELEHDCTFQQADDGEHAFG